MEQQLLENHLRRVDSLDEIKPLVELCKAGRLFEVQDWIAGGKPVNPPPPAKGQRPKSPLEIAVDSGFHSLVKVLLEGGADYRSHDYRGPMNRALEKRRFDIIRLLVENGFDPTTIDMREVFQSWDPEVMEYFIDRGADVETRNPLAFAFHCRISTALRIYKKYRARFPSFPEQANIALRHHAKEGNLKWVSLLLWAGADPYAPGADDYDEEDEDQGDGLSAVGYAALYRRYDVLRLKPIRLDPKTPAMRDVIRYGCDEGGYDFVKTLLEKGYEPNDGENGGCSMIPVLLNDMTWGARFDYNLSWSFRDDDKHIDTERSRLKLKILHLFARHGARWIPVDKAAVASLRRSLLQLRPDYTVEFVWIMAKYRACSEEHIRELLRTPSIKKHVRSHVQRIHELLSDWPQPGEPAPPAAVPTAQEA